MADYTFKGLTGAYGTVTHNPGDDLGDLIVSIATAEGLPIDYYSISNEDDPSKNDTTYDDSSTSIVDAGFVPTSRIICTPRQQGTKERRQKQKLDIAAVKRSDTYDITQLPTQYDGNDVVDNPNVGGLVDRRPWNTP